MRFRFRFPAFVALFLLGFAFLGADALHAGPTQAPAWKLQDLDGKTVQLSDFKGKVVVLDFWATWCPPCRVEIPTFIELQKEYQKQGVVVIGMSSMEQSPAPVVKFVKAQGINYPIVMGDETTMTLYGVEGIPTTFVINPEGKIVARHEDVTKKSVFEADIRQALPAGH